MRQHVPRRLRTAPPSYDCFSQVECLPTQAAAMGRGLFVWRERCGGGGDMFEKCDVTGSLYAMAAPRAMCCCAPRHVQSSMGSGWVCLVLYSRQVQVWACWTVRLDVP